MHTARITNVVVAQPVTLRTPSRIRPNPRIRHNVTSSISQDLEGIYEVGGILLKETITTFVRYPAYNAYDRLTLSDLPVPTEVATDLKRSLTINSFWLVFSCRPIITVEQKATDFETEALDGKDPTALYLNNGHEDKLMATSVTSDTSEMTGDITPTLEQRIMRRFSNVIPVLGRGTAMEDELLLCRACLLRTSHTSSYGWIAVTGIWALEKQPEVANVSLAERTSAATGHGDS